MTKKLKKVQLICSLFRRQWYDTRHECLTHILLVIYIDNKIVKRTVLLTHKRIVGFFVFETRL